MITDHEAKSRRLNGLDYPAMEKVNKFHLDLIPN